MQRTDMWSGADRRLGDAMKGIEREREVEKMRRLKDQAKEHFAQTLEKLWPSKSNEKPS